MQKIDNCLRSLVSNLCGQLRDTPKFFQEEYEHANNGQLSPSTKSLMRMLDTVMDRFENVYICLDALDECPRSNAEQERERDELMARILEICSWGNDSLHFMTTSRKERDIRESLSELPLDEVNFKAISVQGAQVETDIKNYIKQKLKASKFNIWKPAMKKTVEEKLTSQANGM